MNKTLSNMGYRDDSPYRKRPQINIKSKNGLIDMSETGIPLHLIDETGYEKIAEPYSGMHQMQGSNITETPINNNNMTPFQKYQQGGSIVDYLKSQGIDSSKENRKKLAKIMNIDDYHYTADQNTRMLNSMIHDEQNQPIAFRGDDKIPFDGNMVTMPVSNTPGVRSIGQNIPYSSDGHINRLLVDGRPLVDDPESIAPVTRIVANNRIYSKNKNTPAVILAQNIDKDANSRVPAQNASNPDTADTTDWANWNSIPKMGIVKPILIQTPQPDSRNKSKNVWDKLMSGEPGNFDEKTGLPIGTKYMDNEGNTQIAGNNTGWLDRQSNMREAGRTTLQTNSSDNPMWRVADKLITPMTNSVLGTMRAVTGNARSNWDYVDGATSLLPLAGLVKDGLPLVRTIAPAVESNASLILPKILNGLSATELRTIRNIASTETNAVRQTAKIKEALKTMQNIPDDEAEMFAKAFSADASTIIKPAAIPGNKYNIGISQLNPVLLAPKATPTFKQILSNPAAIFQTGGQYSGATLVNQVPAGYNKFAVEGNKTYYDKNTMQAGQTPGNIISTSLPDDQYMQKIANKFSDTGNNLANKGIISRDNVDQYNAIKQRQMVYTQNSPAPVVNPVNQPANASAWSDIYGVTNQSASAMIGGYRSKSRNSTSIQDPGTLNTAADNNAEFTFYKPESSIPTGPIYPINNEQAQKISGTGNKSNLSREQIMQILQPNPIVKQQQGGRLLEIPYEGNTYAINTNNAVKNAYGLPIGYMGMSSSGINQQFSNKDISPFLNKKNNEAITIYKNNNVPQIDSIYAPPGTNIFPYDFKRQTGGMMNNPDYNQQVATTNNGDFNQQAEKAGFSSTEEFANYILANRSKYDENTVKRAMFTINSSHFKH